jgi:hypothetical protein
MGDLKNPWNISRTISLWEHRIRKTLCLLPVATLRGRLKGVPAGEIPHTSRGATRQGKARDRDKLTEKTCGTLLFKVPGVSQRKINHSKEMWHLAGFQCLRYFTCFGCKIFKTFHDLYARFVYRCIACIWKYVTSYYCATALHSGFIVV